MDINKIKDFNQKVLAVFGILAIVLIVIIIFWVGSEFLRDIFRTNDYTETEIVSNKKAIENYKKNIRTHQVSFENLLIVDTINSIYLIPVSQTALELKEYIAKQNEKPQSSLGLMSMYGGRFDDFYYDEKSHNNAIIFDSRTNTTRKLFDMRISINRIYIEKILDKSYVLFAVTYTDTNMDDVLNAQDYKILFIYSTNHGKLVEIETKNNDFVSYHVIKGTDQLILNYGLDKNNDGTYDWDEPMIMKIYSIKQNKLNDLFNPKLIEELQNTLDGKI